MSTGNQDAAGTQFTCSQKLATMQQLVQAVSRTHNLPVLLAVAAKSHLIQNGPSASSGSST